MNTEYTYRDNGDVDSLYTNNIITKYVFCDDFLE